jgi:uncharacterized protein (TIGR00255 family)
MVKSMTAYARFEAKHSWGTIELELRSVNHRFLEMSIRMPEEIRFLEMKVRNQIKAILKRGKVDFLLRLQLHGNEDDKISYDKALAGQIAHTLHEIDKLIYNAAPVKAIDVLNWPGVLATQRLDMAVVEDSLLTSLNSVLAALVEDKEREGQALSELIRQRVDEMRNVIARVKEAMPQILTAQRERLEQRLQNLKAEMDSDRLEQEMVYLAQKADVDEEVDRMETHLDEILRILDSSDEAVGRRLDFLMQELNREANTLGSKSLANLTTQASVDLKVLTEQMREQIQNIE